MKRLTGLLAAPFTPMRENGELNIGIIPKYYNFLKSNKVTGAFICGSTGEGVSLTLAEKKEVINAWTEVAGSDTDFTIMPLVGGTCLADCCELAAFASQAGADAVSFTAPFYFKPGVDMLAKCCAEVAGAARGLPFYYYHIPVLTGVNLPMLSLLQAVTDVPNFAGIKYTHEDFMDFLSCINFEGGRYDMLWGRDENLLSALAIGCRGGVGSTYNYLAPLYNTLIAAYQEGNMTEAARLQQISIDFITLLGKYGGIGTGKAYMKLAGLDCGNFRLPVRNMDPEQFATFNAEAEKLGFDRFKSN